MFVAPRVSRTRAHSSPTASGEHRLRVLDNDTYADWESVYSDNIDLLYRSIYAKVGNRADAEDLTSEVFRTALRPLRLDVSKREVRSYLLTTAQTVLASHWRRTLGVSLTSIDAESDRLALIELGQTDLPSDAPQRVLRILAALPERYRRILELRFLEACTIKEAAHAMNVSVSNAKVQVNSATGATPENIIKIGVR